MISVITATRRPEEYIKMVNDIETKMGDLVSEYIAFTNDPNHRQKYAEIKSQNPKVKIISAPENYIYMNGFDSLYNLLIKAAKDKYLLQIFDVDTVEVNVEELKKDLEEDKDMYGFKMYMQRGDVLETKFQLWKRDLLNWYGLVHENQQFVRQPQVKEISSFKVNHNNARDEKSAKLKKTHDGFIVLEKTEIGTDSDTRNMLYESLAWKIVNENGRHIHKQWFQRHYEINKDLIIEYAKRSNKKYNLGWNING